MSEPISNAVDKNITRSQSNEETSQQLWQIIACTSPENAYNYYYPTFHGGW